MCEYPAKHPPKMEPAHAGEILGKEVLPALDLSVAQAARELGLPRTALGSLLKGLTPVSPEMAVRLGKLCSNSAAFWLRMQACHDLWHAERKLKAEVRNIPEHAVA